ncbi:hypothetical protein Pla22_11560 [Rubripirellula amarantea]|uniref:Polysaccharide lyase n=1 Tax=Rubripirellula amarantea TaxID=2527999 RepID=A0A5C5WSD3_9BACT|nr:heparin lyase I family protein [Rubripirellula amarantea]TWT53527.1 hypothetical protein Pla22_11560 [Rubripirellula amarantea]
MNCHLIVAASCVLLMIVGCSQSDDRDEEISYLSILMPESLVKYSTLDIASRDNIVKVVEDDASYLGFRIYPGQQRLHGGIRSEVSVDFPYREGDTVVYSWQFKLEDDFTSDQPHNRWWIIGQWHDQPDLTKNETWDTHASLSPPISLCIGEKEGSMMLVMTYGVTREDQPQSTSQAVRINRGKWYRAKTRITWSQSKKGQAKFFLSESDHPSTEEPVIEVEGPNMNNAYQHYFKMGMYRHPDIDTDNCIYLDKLSIFVVNSQ